MENFTDYFDSIEGIMAIVKYTEKLERDENHLKRWVDRMWNRIKDDVDGSIEHLLKWYDSDKYRDREYSMGVEPREELLWLLLSVAGKYGKECTEEQFNKYSNVFTRDILVVGSYVIQVMDGQGSIIKINKLTQ